MDACSHASWGYTNSYADLLDLIALGVDPANPARVHTPNGWEALVSHKETILFKGASTYTMVVRDSSLGSLRQAGGRSYAIR